MRYEIDDAFIEARWLWNLDSPYGWSFDTGGGPGADLLHVWSAQLTGGTSF